MTRVLYSDVFLKGWQRIFECQYILSILITERDTDNNNYITLYFCKKRQQSITNYCKDTIIIFFGRAPFFISLRKLLIINVKLHLHVICMSIMSKSFVIYNTSMSRFRKRVIEIGRSKETFWRSLMRIMKWSA